LFGVSSVGKIKGDPGDLLSFSDTAFLFSLDVDSELSVGDVVLSRGVWVRFLLSSDLREHNRSFLELVVEFDGGPSG